MGAMVRFPHIVGNIVCMSQQTITGSVVMISGVEDQLINHGL